MQTSASASTSAVAFADRARSTWRTRRTRRTRTDVLADEARPVEAAGTATTTRPQPPPATRRMAPGL